MNQQFAQAPAAALWGLEGCDTAAAANAALSAQAHAQSYHYDYYQSNSDSTSSYDVAGVGTAQNPYASGSEYVDDDDNNNNSNLPAPAVTAPPSPLADVFPEQWPVTPTAAFINDPILFNQQQQLYTGQAAVPSPGQTSSAYSSYSSAHRSSEDDDETDVTLLLHDDDGDADDDDNTSSKKKQSVLQRRRRNRESMRRARMKEKEVLTMLRATLSQLESRFKQLTQWEESQLASSDPQRVAHCRLLQTKLAHVVQLKRELEAEQGAVQQFLDEKRASVLELQRVLAQWQLEDSDGGDARHTAEKLEILEAQARKYSGSSPAATSSGESGSSSFEFGFTALSVTQVNALLAKFCANLQRVKELARVTPPHDDVAHPVLEVFGWQTHRHIDAQSQMHFEFTKQFPHMDTLEVVERVWRDAMDLQQYRDSRKKENARIRRMEFLQRVDERLGIIVREIKHPEENTIFRTHYALFLLETPEGFMFGIQSINPSAEEQEQLELGQQQRSEAVDGAESPDADSSGSASNEKVVWVDVWISIEIQRRTLLIPPSAALEQTDTFHDNQASDANSARQDYCEVRWRGKTNYKTAKHAAENAVSFLLGILKWENNIIGPRFHLTAS